MKLIIAGGRDFEDWDLALDSINHLLSNTEMTDECVIVSGGARGADRIGERYAKLYDIPIKKFIPDWNGLGKRAGMVRNRDMAEYGTHLIAFWDGKSSGTEGMISIAKQLGLKIRVIKY